MGITDYIKTRLLNNRVEQYNTKRSYWGEDERQPRTDRINTGLDLPDALPPVINKTIANARYAVKLDGYTSGNVRSIWCDDGYLIAYDPSWIFTDLYSS